MIGIVHAIQILISIHALRAEGDPCSQPIGVNIHISIHALRAEGDPHLPR